MEKYNLNEGNESLKKILLMMKYDNKKTLSENENNLNTTLNENSVNDYWNKLNKDTRNKFAKINGAVSGPGTNEGKFIEGVKLLTKDEFKTLEDLLTKVGMGGYRSFTDMVNGELGINDLRYVKDIVNHLVNIGFKSGYKEVKGRFVEKSFTVETPDTTQTITTTTTTIKQNKYKQCSGTYKLYCYNKTSIGKVQGCLGLKQDGYFGPKTQNALKSIGYNNGFTDNDIEKICNKKNTTPETNNLVSTPQSQITADSDIDPRYNV